MGGGWRKKAHDAFLWESYKARKVVGLPGNTKAPHWVPGQGVKRAVGGVFPRAGQRDDHGPVQVRCR